jgi:hypothetical protein
MYRVRQQSGLGDSSPQCGVLAINDVSTAKACWCLSWPSLCSTESYQAAMALIHPDLVYGTMPTPPPHAAVGAGLSTTPVPYPCSDGSLATSAANCPAFSAAVDTVIADQQTAWNAQNAAYMAGVQSNLDQVAASQAGGTNWLLYGGIAAGVLVLLMIRGQGERRGR